MERNNSGSSENEDISTHETLDRQQIPKVISPLSSRKSAKKRLKYSKQHLKSKNETKIQKSGVTVAVRVRPLSFKEIKKRHQYIWGIKKKRKIHEIEPTSDSYFLNFFFNLFNLILISI